MKVTIKDIAKQCNVSAMTVSNIINNRSNVSAATREKVLQAIKELNYQPNFIAQNLKSKSTRIIGVIVEDITIFHTPSIIDGITHYCEQNNYQMLLYNLRLVQRYQHSYYHSTDYYEEIHKEFNEFISSQVEGIIYVSGYERELTFIPEYVPVPLVVVYAQSLCASIPSVIIDDFQGGQHIMDHIIGLGHRKIGMITGLTSNPHARERVRGYLAAIRKHEIPYEEELIVEGDWEYQSGYDLTDQLLDLGVTCIFCQNDFMAVGVYKRLNELNLVIGKDISVVGFDNRENFDFLSPRLTTVALPLYDVGYKAGELMIKAIIEQREVADGKHLHPIPCTIIDGGSLNAPNL